MVLAVRRLYCGAYLPLGSPPPRPSPKASLFVYGAVGGAYRFTTTLRVTGSKATLSAAKSFSMWPLRTMAPAS